MACDTIICDWNGTIIKNRDEKPILETIAVDLFKSSIPFHVNRAIRLIRVRGELQSLYWQGRQDTEFDFIREMFTIYNRKIINGLPVSFIHRSVDRYAARGETQRKLDRRILRPIRFWHQNGKTTGILSSGYGYGIDRILAVAGFRGYFDFREANSFNHEGGRAIEFLLNIYKNKPQLLLRVLRHRNLDEKRTVYIGDSEDDEGCFEIAKYPVVAFFATDELKQRCASRYEAFIPQDEKDLANYLMKI
jgi:phosphoserine phosphatase